MVYKINFDKFYILQNEECFKLWFSQLAKELGECKEIANTGGIGLYFNEPIILPQFLTSKEKNSFSKLVNAVKHVKQNVHQQEK